MRIRTLVPALACLAAAPLATAADGPAVKFDGFVDTIWSAAGYEHGGADTGFQYAGKLGVSATISDKVSAQVDLNVNTGGGVESYFNSRQVYGVWKVADNTELKTGKFISDYGWTAAYAPGLYRINGGIITQFYGVDQVGANAKYTMGDITAALTVANGFFGEGASSDSQDPQGNEDYAVGLDVVYSLHDMGSVNLELINDAGAETVTTDQSPGSGYHIGLNATLTPSKEITIGAEVIKQGVNQKGAGAEDTEHFGIMALVNYKLATAMPMSVTFQLSRTDVDGNNAISETTDEVALALLTNPAGTDKLGANLEINYVNVNFESEDSEYGYGLSGEILYVF